MFKYISEILSKLSTGQRLWALIFLLSSITFISVGPKIVESFTHDNEDLSNKIELQRSIIESLNKRVIDLNDQVMDGQMSCTNKFAKREKEIMDLLGNLESVARSEHGKILSQETSYERNNNRPTYVDEPGDPNEPRVLRMETQSPPVEKTVVVKSDNSNMIKMIGKVKKDIKDNTNQ